MGGTTDQNGSCTATCGPDCAGKECGDDCASVLCDDVFHACKAFTPSGSGGDHGSDADGICFCDLTVQRQLVCDKNNVETEADTGNDCPAGTSRVDIGGGQLLCFKLCGAA